MNEQLAGAGCAGAGRSGKTPRRVSGSNADAERVASRHAGEPDRPAHRVPCVATRKDGAPCGHACKPRVVKKAHASRERRIVEGVEYCWYCSRACACRDAGRRSAALGRHLTNLDKSTRAEAFQRRRRAEFADDLHYLARRGVPKPVAEVILERVFARGEVVGYNRAYHRHVRGAREVA